MFSGKLKSRFASAVLSGVALFSSGCSSKSQAAPQQETGDASALAGVTENTQPQAGAEEKFHPLETTARAEPSKDGILIDFKVRLDLKQSDIDALIVFNPVMEPESALRRFSIDVSGTLNKWWEQIAAKIDMSQDLEPQKQIVRDALPALKDALIREVGLTDVTVTPLGFGPPESPSVAGNDNAPTKNEPQTPGWNAPSSPQDERAPPPVGMPRMAQEYPGFDDTDMFNPDEQRPFVSFARTADGVLLMASFNALYSMTDTMKLEANGRVDKIPEITDIVQKYLDIVWKDFGSQVPASVILGRGEEAQQMAPLLANAMKRNLAAAQVEIESRTGMSVIISPVSIDPIAPGGTHPQKRGQTPGAPERFQSNPKKYTL